MLGRYAWMMIGEDKIYGDPMGVEADFVRESVTEFVRLVLLYHSIAQGQELPYLPPTRKFEKKKKVQAAQKKYSLFRIHYLDSPPDRFGRPEQSLGGDGWRLDHRVPVRGHFRMQQHGPESKLRKLTWIGAHYRGPEDGAEKVLLDRLKGSRR
jgi:hypothetical protein